MWLSLLSYRNSREASIPTVPLGKKIIHQGRRGLGTDKRPTQTLHILTSLYDEIIRKEDHWRRAFQPFLPFTFLLPFLLLSFCFLSRKSHFKSTLKLQLSTESVAFHIIRRGQMLLGFKEGNSYIEGFEIHGRVNSLKDKVFLFQEEGLWKKKAFIEMAVLIKIRALILYYIQ